MALGTSKISLFLTDPFVVILKPAVSMSAEPDVSVMVIAIIETLLFLLAAIIGMILLNIGLGVASQPVIKVIEAGLAMFG